MDKNRVTFSFGWLALKLLGKSLYSNAWSAISELVANGFDAKASNVYVFIDSTNKENSIIEIFDNGTGMDASNLELYAKVGFNRRVEMPENTDEVMGRKGIGKLAALYLSENYFLLTKSMDGITSWKMKYVENEQNESEQPYLEEVDLSKIDLKCKNIWNEFKTGTMLQLNHVDLTGLGDVAYESLNKKLSNYFALDAMEDRNIFLYIKTSNSREEVSKDDFSPVSKEIAFKNFAFIEFNPTANFETIKEEFQVASTHKVKIRYPKLRDEYYLHQIDISPFKGDVTGVYKYINKQGNEVSKPYSMTGWIGLHSTIDKILGEQNDERFLKSQFYNPIQLRLYVRNKLAMENFLPVINKTQAFVNYIEGEIHFDILDDDDMPDIATSNRQGFDEHDGRVQILADIVSKIITQLITKRNNLSEKMRENEKVIINDRKNIAKTKFAKAIDEDIKDYPELNIEQRNQLTQMVVNKVEGDVTLKNSFMLFISHSSADKCIADFIYYLLKKRGVEDSEIFYTSRDDTVEQYSNLDSLSKQIKECIVSKNTLLLYLTSKDYKQSEYCMFEGGAGWATRAVNEYELLSLTHEEIPEFLTNSKMEFCLECNGNIQLNRKMCLYLIRLLNRIINHLNNGRELVKKNLIKPFEDVVIPTDLELDKCGKTVLDFIDYDIIEHWNRYIGNNLSEYLEKRYSNSKKKS